MSRKHKKRREVIIMRGPSGSGKSSYAKKHIEGDSQYARVSRDNFRYMANNYAKMDYKIEDVITPLEYKTAEEFLLSGFDVIWDNTFVRPKHLKGVLNLLDKLRYYRGLRIELQVIDFSDTPVETCIERDKNDDRKTVGPDVIRKQHDQATQGRDEFYQLIDHFNSKPIGYFMDLHQFDDSNPYAIIFDIDGTLALIGERGPFEWDAVEKDYINLPICNIARMEYTSGYTIILMSGRSEDAREGTESWLEENNINYHNLFMRPANNYEKDNKIKKKLFDENVDSYYNVVRAYDDRLSTTEVWFNKGIYTINVNQGNFNF